jgi:predicted RNA-binding Zn-ribbon protein involved in translation (DUF1610 family)
MRHNLDKEVTLTARTLRVRVYIVSFKCPECGRRTEDYHRLDARQAEEDRRFLLTLDKCETCSVSGHY